MLIGLSLLSQPAQALNITYTFGAPDDGLSVINKTDSGSGVTATFSNINSGNGNKFSADNDGIFVSTAGSYGSQFNISFNQAVKFISYNIVSSFISSGATATFSLSNPNRSSSLGNNLAGGSYNFSNQFSVDANSPSTLTASFTDDPVNGNFSQIQSITVATATPVLWETDALPIVDSTILFAGGLWAKRKFAKPLQK